MPKPGETLQRIVSALERTLNANAGVTITSPKRLADLTTKRGREHDVVVQFEKMRVQWTIALECRDRSRSVDVPQIEAFAMKCQRTGVNCGMIVSPKGFTKTALKVANDQKIVCLSLDEVDAFDWCLAPGLAHQTHTPIHMSFFVDIGRKAVPGTQVFFADGTLLDDNLARNVVLSEFQRHVDRSLPDGEHVVGWVDETPTCYAVEPDGSRLVVNRITCSMRYRQISSLVPFEFRSYVEVASGKKLSAAVSAHFEMGERGVSLVIAEHPSGDKLVTLATQPVAKPKQVRRHKRG